MHKVCHNLSLSFQRTTFDGAEFLTLTESEVKAMVPPIGLARKVMRLLPQQEVTLVSVLGWLCLLTFIVEQMSIYYVP